MDVPFFWSFFDPAQAMPHTEASSLIFSVPNRFSEEASAVDQNHRSRCAAAISLLTVCFGLCPSLFADGYWRFEQVSGASIFDSGQYGLSGTMNARPAASLAVPVEIVPQNDLANVQSLDLGWIDSTSGGVVTIEDPVGQLSFGHQSFTIEAWVKLDQLSNTNNSNQRQWLCMKKPLPSADTELDYGFLVQAGTAGTSGRELAFLYGDNGATTTIVSSLEVNDLDWHFVSLAYNLETKELRFGIDGLFETVPLDKPGFLLYLPVLNSGPLRVGAHQNASGTNNQFLRGSIDELRITRGWLPVDQLLDADWPDCNQNGMPDAMDLHAATSADCNLNFVPDECDVASGASADCQDDGIPDECQLALAPSYRWDDERWEGWPGYSTTYSDGAYTAWLHSFTTTAERTNITHVDMQVSAFAVGENMLICVWSDPNGDGNPSDAQVLSSLPVQVDEAMAWEVVRFDVPDVDLEFDGVPFFVGGVMGNPGVSALMIDFAPPHFYGVSWIVGRDTPIDPNNLSEEAVEFALIEDSFPGNYVVQAVADTGLGEADCNQNGVPDACDLSSGESVDMNANLIPDECECLGDIDATGSVNFDDLLAVLSVWGNCPARCDEDLDADGQVGFTDLLLVLSFWGSCPE